MSLVHYYTHLHSHLQLLLLSLLDIPFLPTSHSRPSRRSLDTFVARSCKWRRRGRKGIEPFCVRMILQNIGLSVWPVTPLQQGRRIRRDWSSSNLMCFLSESKNCVIETNWMMQCRYSKIRLWLHRTHLHGTRLFGRLWKSNDTNSRIRSILMYVASVLSNKLLLKTSLRWNDAGIAPPHEPTRPCSMVLRA